MNEAPKPSLSKPYPNSHIETYERHLALMVDNLKTNKGGYIRGIIPEWRAKFIMMYVNMSLKNGWRMQTEYYKGAAEFKQEEAKKKGLEELVRTEAALDTAVPVIGIQEL